MTDQIATSVCLVALLRGVNVGRGNRIAMPVLRDLLVGLGYADVRTLLQSGNAVFTCPKSAVSAAATTIEQTVAAGAGVSCRVVVRTAAELDAAIAADPLVEVATDPTRHLLGFLSGAPDAAATGALAGRDFGDDQVRLLGQHVYLWCPAGVLAGPFAKVNWERTLGVAVTMRNWSTVTKLAALARESDIPDATSN